MDKVDAKQNGHSGKQNHGSENKNEMNGSKELTIVHNKYLTDEEYANLVKYKHFAEKTWYEIWMLKNVTWWLEQKVIPQWWSPNTITVIGNVPLLLAGVITVYIGGTRFHDDEELGKLEPLPNWVLLFAAFSVQWFSFFDMMDGQRARRLKVGSPIGRIVDEAGDLMIYSLFALYGGYLLKAKPGIMNLSCASINSTAYAMEMAFIITGEFDQHAGEFDIGPVEIELIVATLFGFAGVYGYQGVDTSMNEVVHPSIGQYIPDYVKMQHALACFFAFLIFIFLVESYVKIFKHSPGLATRLSLSPLVPLIPAIIQSYLGTKVFREHFVLFYLIHSITTNTLTYRLMISNMTRRIPYSPFGLETVFGWIPLIAHWMAPEEKKGEYEIIATYASIAISLITFYGHIYLLSQQWLQREGDKRKWWTIPVAPKGKQQ